MGSDGSGLAGEAGDAESARDGRDGRDGPARLLAWHGSAERHAEAVAAVRSVKEWPLIADEVVAVGGVMVGGARGFNRRRRRPEAGPALAGLPARWVEAADTVHRLLCDASAGTDAADMAQEWPARLVGAVRPGTDLLYAVDCWSAGVLGDLRTLTDRAVAEDAAWCWSVAQGLGTYAVPSNYADADRDPAAVMAEMAARAAGVTPTAGAEAIAAVVKRFGDGDGDGDGDPVGSALQACAAAAVSWTPPGTEAVWAEAMAVADAACDGHRLWYYGYVEESLSPARAIRRMVRSAARCFRDPAAWAAWAAERFLWWSSVAPCGESPPLRLAPWGKPTVTTKPPAAAQEDEGVELPERAVYVRYTDRSGRLHDPAPGVPALRVWDVGEMAVYPHMELSFSHGRRASYGWELWRWREATAGGWPWWLGAGRAAAPSAEAGTAAAG